MCKSISLFLLSLMLTFTSSMCAQTKSRNTVEAGPEKGILFIAGGGHLSDQIVHTFIDLAGGKDAPIVVIPTAAGLATYDERFLQLFTTKGVANVTLLHTVDRRKADSESFILPLKKAAAVWFTGGRQWRLVDAYKGTKTEKELWNLLDRNGVIGGSSAGATIQGSYLARGDTKTNQIMMGDHEEGFGFLKNVAIDQHVLTRNRHFDLFNILKNKPELLGIGIDENTAIIVKGDQFEVLGASYVLIYDQNFWSREGSDLKTIPDDKSRFYFLQHGDKYDLKNRRVILEKE